MGVLRGIGPNSEAASSRRCCAIQSPNCEHDAASSCEQFAVLPRLWEGYHSSRPTPTRSSRVHAPFTPVGGLGMP
eukprot:15433063-Alexandrium_andersonii.AAC.1